MLIEDFENINCSCGGTAVNEIEVQAYREREIAELLEHTKMTPEEIYLHAEAMTKDLTTEQIAEREAKIEEYGDREAYEFREVADSLWAVAREKVAASIEAEPVDDGGKVIDAGGAGGEDGRVVVITPDGITVKEQ